MGRPHTEESRAKLRDAALNYWSDNAAEAVARGERMRAGKIKSARRCGACAAVFEGYGQSRFCEECRAYRRRKLLLTKYGITPEEYDIMFAAQRGLCAICFKPHGSTRSDALRVDHCHDTGAFRGLLCDSCNLVLGKMQDDPERLRRAAQYLETHNQGETE